MQQDKWKKSKQFLKSRGYYIALFLCLIAVGTSGLLYYRRQQPPAKPSESGSVADPSEPSSAAPSPSQPTAVRPNQPALSNNAVDAPQQQTPAEPLKVMAPLQGQMLQGYAVDALAYNETTKDWRTHAGIDIAAPAGTEVCAAADGVVYAVYDDESLGRTVVVRHTGNYTTYYSNLAEDVRVSAGDTVDAGAILGVIGDTALTEVAAEPHLHFAVVHNDKDMDPAEFLNS